LRPAGFDILTHQSYFGPGGQRISDPEVIRACAEEHRVLITADSDFGFMYAAEIKQAKLAIFVLSNNHDGPEKWAKRIISAKEQIFQQIADRKRPFVAHINDVGSVNRITLYRRSKTKDLRIAQKHKRKQSKRHRKGKRRHP
jgi:predicted nuclease of predicted toxin-antitoxin system